MPKHKPPLSVRVTTIGPGGELVESVTVFSPDELRCQGLEEARFKKHALGRRRLAVVYNAVKDIIGKTSDAKCADLSFGPVNTMLRQLVHLIAVDISHKESNPARRRAEVDAVLKILARIRPKAHWRRPLLASEND